MNEQTCICTRQTEQGNSKESFTEGAPTTKVGLIKGSCPKVATQTTVLTITSGSKRHAKVVGYATVLDDDFTRDVLKKMRWHFDDNGYPRHSPSYSTPVRLHNLVFRHYNGDILNGFVVDHEDRNKLNNIPTNLRSVTRAVNSANKKLQRNNKTGCPRVHIDKRTGKFIAQASVPGTGRSVHLGCFDSRLEAVDAAKLAFSTTFPSVNPSQYSI